MASTKNRLTKSDIIKGLKKLDLKKGDHIIVHSALSSLGEVVRGADTLIDAIIEVVGPEGTIIVPTFGSSDKVFNPKKSSTNLGIIAQTLWQRPNAVRSRHPLASVAAIGAKADWLIEGHENKSLAHGEETPYTKLAEINGKILLLGVDQDRNTCLHCAEEIAQLPYLRTARGKYVDRNRKIVKKNWKYFPGPHRNFIALQQWFEKKGFVKKIRLGNSVMQVIAVKELLETLKERLADEPDLFISKNPNLPDAIWQRADIINEKLSQESFTLAADSQYAGLYIEQIVENLKYYGIRNIVLSFINTIPWYAIEAHKRKWYLDFLRREKISVAAVRLPIITEHATALLNEAKTSALILPSTTEASMIKKLASNKYRIFLENITATSNQMNSICQKLPNIKVAFNPLNFVQVGECPFVFTYSRTALRKRLGLLFINDGLATGQRTFLEEGLAEIKELISILRCKSFSGLFVLQAENHGTFRQTTEKFMSILKELGNVPENY